MSLCHLRTEGREERGFEGDGWDEGRTRGKGKGKGGREGGRGGRERERNKGERERGTRERERVVGRSPVNSCSF